jgi:hypothetical protein
MPAVAELRAGDRAIGASVHGKRVLTVTKVTATQVVCGDLRFRRRDGRGLGGGYGVAFLRAATPEAVEAVECEEAARRLATVKAGAWARLGLARLRAVWAELAAAGEGGA